MPSKAKTKRKITAEGVAVSILRSLRGWNQTELSKASGIGRAQIWRYEKGYETPRRPTMERLCAAVGVPFSAIERLLPGIREALKAVEKGREVEAPPDRFTADVQLPAALLDFRQPEDATPDHARQDAQGLWEYLEKKSNHDRRVLIEGAAEYQSWGLCERLCRASESAAADDAGVAVELAELAVRTAELVPGEEAFRLGLQGYAWAYLGNARRVKGNLPGADEAFARSDNFLSTGEPAISGLLDCALLPDLKASLRHHQGRFDEALELHDQALAMAKAQDHGIILLNKAQTLAEMERYEESFATLKLAEPWVQARHELRAEFALRCNQAIALVHLGQYEEAEARLPEIARLVTRLGTGLDKLRLRWLEGKVAAGLGRRNEALAAFSQVRTEFKERGIAFDTALVTLELAMVHLELGHTGEVKTLAREMVTIFEAQDGHREALAAIRLFCRAAEQERVTLDLAQRLIAYLNRARHDPKLRFEAWERSRVQMRSPRS